MHDLDFQIHYTALSPAGDILNQGDAQDGWRSGSSKSQNDAPMFDKLIFCMTLYDSVVSAPKGTLTLGGGLRDFVWRNGWPPHFQISSGLIRSAPRLSLWP
jgi:hypothetical protein